MTIAFLTLLFVALLAVLEVVRREHAVDHEPDLMARYRKVWAIPNEQVRKG